MFKQWRQGIRGRFSDRDDLERQVVYEWYWSDLSKPAVTELFDLIETEYQHSPGLLRPEDATSKLLEPIKPVHWLKWIFYQAHTEDSASELSYQLGKRQHLHGTHYAWQRMGVVTIDDLVRAWCGQLPRLRERNEA
jgi:hypothetical protein